MHRAFPSKFLGNRRDILVYLPPGYRRFSWRRHSVLYLQDGQNVFDAATSFGGVEWSVDETAERLIRNKVIDPIIIVAVANMGEDRVHEYTPTPGVIEAKGRRKKRSRGLARLYGRFLMEELKPFIDRKYRTRRGPTFTGLGGSSLGGLATLAIGMLYPQKFRRLMVMSPSVWWDDRVILREVAALQKKLNVRIWLDAGTREGAEVIPDARLLRDAFVAKGWEIPTNLMYFEARGGEHNERSWAKRVGPVLKYLFPPRDPSESSKA